MADVSPTTRQRELGTRLRQLRTANGLTVEDVAKALLCSPAKISRMETGARRTTLRDVRDLCQVYRVASKTSAELMELAREAREPGWWTSYDDLKITPFMGMEQAATAITCLGMYFVPALLQTVDYAREIISSKLPDLVFVEGLVSHLYLERPDELARYREALEYLRDVAHNARDSAKIIEDIRQGSPA